MSPSGCPVVHELAQSCIGKCSPYSLNCELSEWIRFWFYGHVFLPLGQPSEELQLAVIFM
jgi:hypothetical protein